MNKKFVSLMVCSLLLGGAASTTLVSCSDHDDDITNLNNTTADLNKQLATLQEALKANEDAAKQADAAAKQALADAAKAAQSGDAAAAEAKKAVAEAELAKKAAADAKAEAIAAVIKQLEPLINGKADAAEVAKLAGRIDGIEKGLKNIDLTDINKQLGDQAKTIADQAKLIETLQGQVKALENFKNELTKVGGTIDGINGKISKIEDTIKELNGLKAQVSTNTTAIGQIQEELKGISAKISKEIGNSVNTIAGVLMQRLTSVTLMPDLYVDGIPTIDFKSAKYTKKVYKGATQGWVNATTGKTQYIVSNNSAVAHYRLNPGTIKEGDIDVNGMGYVSRIATTRADEVLNDIVTVAGVKIENDGTMTVNLGKGNTESLELSGNQIYTASLKVPIASKHLFTEQGESSAAVYSEFTRLAETYFTPELAFVPGAYDGGSAVSHMNDSAALYKSAAGQMVNEEIVYNHKGYDLYDLVEGCAFVAPDTHTPMTRKDLQSYGFDIVFGIADRAYAPTTPDGTDQQKFVKLSGENNSILTPIASNGVAGNKVIIGKQPILRAELRDMTNKNVIDVRYFKVLFTAEDMQDVVINWEPTITTVGNACQGASYDFTWKDMAEKVLMKIGKEGMDKATFTKIYSVNAPVITPANDQQGTLTARLVESNMDASIPVMSWTLTSDQLGKLKQGQNSVTVTKSITFTDPEGLNPKVVINLKWTVTTNVAAITLGAVDGLKWQNNTMKVYPVPMALPYDGKQKAAYSTNILEGRKQPYVNGLLGCGFYDIDYATSGNPTYVGKPLAFPSPFGHWKMTTANQAQLKEVIYSIENNAAGKNLVSNGGTIKINWSSDINGLSKNRYVFGTTNLQIVKILSLNTLLGDVIVDDSHSQEINIADKFTMTDAYGHIVAKVATEEEPLAGDYYKFYGVKDAVFGSDITLADDAANTVNKRTLASLNMTANVDNTSGVLTFQNNGAPLQANAYLIVPVTVEHLWGTLKGHIAVPLHKSNAPLSKRRR